jgi:cellobiose epimerase
MNENDIFKKLRNEVDKEVKDNILSYWMKNTVDNENGGFYGFINNKQYIDKKADKGGILNFRILWTFSKAFNVYKDEKYLKIAKRAYEYVTKYFWDDVYGGIYWMVDYMGAPSNTKKQIYCQAFAIYGFSEYYMATGNIKALDYAVKLFNLIEEKSYDIENKGYFEAYAGDWSEIEDLRLSDIDLNEKKSMNTHLHVLEAYTNLYSVWKNNILKDKLEDLIHITIDKIINNKTWHFNLFFDEFWNIKSNIVSYGHDIEGSWLLMEAAEVLGTKTLIENVKEISVNMAQKVYEEGVDKTGGILNESRGEEIDTDKHWWPQAEGVIGFLNAYELTGKEHFLKEALNTWEYISKNIIDRVNGEWFWLRTVEGDTSKKDEKVGPWKCPYHNSRMCFEILRRLKN